MSHARSPQELDADEAWTRERAGWEIPTSRNDWTAKRNVLTVIGLGNRSPLAWRRDGGVVCIDPAPKARHTIEKASGWMPTTEDDCRNHSLDEPNGREDITASPTGIEPAAHGVGFGPNESAILTLWYRPSWPVCRCRRICTSPLEWNGD